MRRGALLGSVGYSLVLIVTVSVAYSPLFWVALFTVQVGPWVWWALLGGGIVGATLGVTVVRYGLLSPVLVVAAAYVVTVYRMWETLTSPRLFLPGTPLDLYAVGWPVLLGVALGCGLVERHVRSIGRTGRSSNGK
ncbi:hypothetical protein [Candidatus Halobonum tyrrellensis]|uniref:Uncharacterized protein n=1 Tax=Candidatus Halobonum tyrrellensis G22 TaxID=1324957 RepID=V4HJS9_9EURY|nr:hypothetical protein [Candidatus Halobonum tyrrellensis]ESP88174.1 hypothetical protein K933_10200 [Candidatus Halobonum tyrrellensis G22]